MFYLLISGRSEELTLDSFSIDASLPPETKTRTHPRSSRVPTTLDLDLHPPTISVSPTELTQQTHHLPLPNRADLARPHAPPIGSLLSPPRLNSLSTLQLRRRTNSFPTLLRSSLDPLQTPSLPAHLPLRNLRSPRRPPVDQPRPRGGAVEPASSDEGGGTKVDEAPGWVVEQDEE